MEASIRDVRVLVCLPVEEPEGDAVLAAAVDLARDLRAELSIVCVYPPNWRGPKKQRPLPSEIQATSWHLRTDNPIKPLLIFAAQHRITHLILGENASCRWGQPFARAVESRGQISMSWFMSNGRCRALSFESS